ncbi:hypothetical protein I3760_16G037000, partial [Carya illinoinensis]
KWPNLEKGKGCQNKSSKKDEDGCYRCGITGCWARTCRTTKYLVDLLYQAFRKRKTKKFETNFIEPSNVLVSMDGEDITHLDIFDFFENPSGRVDNLIGDGSVNFN